MCTAGNLATWLHRTRAAARKASSLLALPRLPPPSPCAGTRTSLATRKKNPNQFRPLTQGAHNRASSGRVSQGGGGATPGRDDSGGERDLEAGKHCLWNTHSPLFARNKQQGSRPQAGRQRTAAGRCCVLLLMVVWRRWRQEWMFVVVVEPEIRVQGGVGGIGSNKR